MAANVVNTAISRVKYTKTHDYEVDRVLLIACARGGDRVVILIPTTSTHIAFVPQLVDLGEVPRSSSSSFSAPSR